MQQLGLNYGISKTSLDDGTGSGYYTNRENSLPGVGDILLKSDIQLFKGRNQELTDTRFTDQNPYGLEPTFQTYQNSSVATDLSIPTFRSKMGKKLASSNSYSSETLDQMKLLRSRLDKLHSPENKPTREAKKERKLAGSLEKLRNSIGK